MAEATPVQPARRIANRDALLVGLVATPVGMAILAFLGNTDRVFYFHITELIGGVGVLILGAGVAGFILAFSGSNTAPCPSCRQPFELAGEDGKPGPRLCRGCSNYLELHQGSLRLVEPDRLESKPVFRTSLPKLLVWPDGCCVCRAPATRKLALKLESRKPLSRLEEGSVAPGPQTVEVALKEEGGRWSTALEVPACDQHGDGAELSSSLGGQVRLGFRSLGYLLAFCEKNDLKPR